MNDGDGARPLRVVIMGCGRTGAYLAELLDNAGHRVTIIDLHADAFTRLPEDFGGDTLVANAIDEDVLRSIGLHTCDAFVAATSGDNRNIMASQVAQTVFHVPRVVARIKDPSRARFFGERGLSVDCRTRAGIEVLLELAEEEALQEA